MLQGRVCISVSVHVRANEQDCLGIGLWEFAVVQLCETMPRSEFTGSRVWGQLGCVCELHANTQPSLNAKGCACWSPCEYVDKGPELCLCMGKREWGCMQV